jgi:predicted permease
MIQKIKLLFASLALSVSMAVPAVAVPVLVHADTNNITSGLCTGANAAANGPNGGTDCTVAENGNSSLKTVAARIVNIFSLIVGIVAVIMIIYGGFRYITSGGDSGRVGTAKNTLIYAIIGLIIVALAQFIVHYVLTTTSSSVSPG